MCRFHSFLMDAQEGRCIEVLGEVHHSSIANSVGVRQDAYMLPEFHVDRRDLVFDYGPKTLREQIAASLNSQGMSTRDSGAGDFIAEAWGRATQRGKRTPFNAEAVRKIDDFLLQRFGSAGAFIDFVEPQWGTAAPHATELLIPQARVLDPTEREVQFGIKSLKVSMLDAAPMISFSASGSVPGAKDLIARENCRVSVAIGADGRMRDLDASIKSIEAAGERATINFELPYARVMKWMDGTDLAELDFRASLLVAGDVGFDDFKRLFKVARNRMQAWKQDVKTFVNV